MINIKAIDKWHKTKAGYIIFGLLELVIAYGLASWAIDSGSLWLYLLTFVFLIGALKNWFKTVGKSVNGGGSKAKRA